MQTFYLRFETRDAALAALLNFGLAEYVDGEPRIPSHGYYNGARVDFDIVGLRDEALDYLVNVLWHGDSAPDLSALADALVAPASPDRVFAA